MKLQVKSPSGAVMAELGVLSFLLWTAIVNAASGFVYHCIDKTPVTITSSSSATLSTLTASQRFYRNSQQCDWTITAPPGERIQLTVKDSDLEYAPVGGTCQGHDYLSVREGTTSSSPELATWCGDRKPHVMISKYNSVHVLFRANSRNVHNQRGAVIDFDVFDPRVRCPMGSEYFNQTGYCYSLHRHPSSWTEAQRQCNVMKGNLVTISSQEEQKFISGVVQQVVHLTPLRFWIGMTDIEKEADFKWIDPDMRVKFASWDGGSPPSAPDDDCVTMDSQTGFWNSYRCSTIKPYVCKMHPTKEGEFFPIPDYYEDKEGDAIPPWAIIVMVAVAAGLISGAIMIFLWRKQILTKSCAKTSRKRYTGVHRPIPAVHYSGVQGVSASDTEGHQRIPSGHQISSSSSVTASAPPLDNSTIIPYGITPPLDNNNTHPCHNVHAAPPSYEESQSARPMPNVVTPGTRV